jgi:predicted PurR-regulated permease PerM
VAVLAVAVVAFVTALGALLVDQLGALADAIPGYAEQITGFLNDALGTELSGDQLAADLRDNAGVQDFVRGLAAGAVGVSTTLVGLVLQGLTIGLFTFYLVADRPGYAGPPAWWPAPVPWHRAGARTAGGAVVTLAG